MLNTISDKTENLISLAEAARICSYSQEYLSLRARQGKLKATKLGRRNWVTTRQWLADYIKENAKMPSTGYEIPDTKYESINWPGVFQKVGYGFLILLLGFGLLKVSPNIISWTSEGVAGVSQWLIETGELLEKKSEELTRQNFQFAAASILDNLLALDFTILIDKMEDFVNISNLGAKKIAFLTQKG